jgi:predicted dehydrogenase
MDRILIMGMGRAGQRHARILDEMGMPWHVSVDPKEDVASDYFTLHDAVEEAGPFDLAVVCTPPEMHLSNIKEAFSMGIKKILCEKPLCGLGQDNEAERLAREACADVSVAYNWRWHPQIRTIDLSTVPFEHEAGWHFFSSLYRPDLPEWGLLLDHVSHAVDTLRFLSRNEPRLDWADHKVVTFENGEGLASAGPDYDGWNLKGQAGSTWFDVHESIWLTQRRKRTCRIDIPNGMRVDLDVGPDALEDMFTSMWADVLAWVNGDAPPPVSIADSLKTQAVLSRAVKMAGEVD